MGILLSFLFRPPPRPIAIIHPLPNQTLIIEEPERVHYHWYPSHNIPSPRFPPFTSDDFFTFSPVRTHPFLHNTLSRSYARALELSLRPRRIILPSVINRNAGRIPYTRSIVDPDDVIHLQPIPESNYTLTPLQEFNFK